MDLNWREFGKQSLMERGLQCHRCILSQSFVLSAFPTSQKCFDAFHAISIFCLSIVICKICCMFVGGEVHKFQTKEMIMTLR